MFTNVKKYRIYCTTQSKWEYAWSETPITTCPTDPISHSVNADSVDVVDAVSNSNVTVVEENTPTGGHFGCEVIAFDANGNSTTTVDYSSPINFGALSISFVPRGGQRPDGIWDASYSQEGDVFEIIALPDTIIGTISSDVSVSDTVINVNPSVIANIKLGYYVKLDNLSNFNDCGRVIAIDSINNTITVENPPSNSFLAGSPTYIKIGIKMIRNFEIGPPGPYIIGESKIGASHIKAGTVIRIKYTNKTSAKKRVRFNLEDLY